MEIYDNDRDQVEALKRFLNEYGTAIAVVIALIIAAVIGWHYWNNTTEKNAREQSLAYEQVLSAVTDKKTPAAQTAAEKFISDNRNSYGALAALQLAQQLVEQQQTDKAAAQLQQALADTKDSDLQAIISLRLARIQLEQKKPDAALQTLATIKGNGWLALVADVRGDALLSKGDKQAARDAWSKGLQSQTPEALRNILQMKIDNISA